MLDGGTAGQRDIRSHRLFFAAGRCRAREQAPTARSAGRPCAVAPADAADACGSTLIAAAGQWRPAWSSRNGVVRLVRRARRACTLDTSFGRRYDDRRAKRSRGCSAWMVERSCQATPAASTSPAALPSASHRGSSARARWQRGAQMYGLCAVRHRQNAAASSGGVARLKQAVAGRERGRSGLLAGEQSARARGRWRVCRSLENLCRILAERVAQGATSPPCPAPPVTAAMSSGSAPLHAHHEGLALFAGMSSSAALPPTLLSNSARARPLPRVSRVAEQCLTSAAPTEWRCRLTTALGRSAKPSVNSTVALSHGDDAAHLLKDLAARSPSWRRKR